MCMAYVHISAYMRVCIHIHVHFVCIHIYAYFVCIHICMYFVCRHMYMYIVCIHICELDVGRVTAQTFLFVFPCFEKTLEKVTHQHFGYYDLFLCTFVLSLCGCFFIIYLCVLSVKVECAGIDLVNIRAVNNCIIHKLIL